jgi:hypothetical protein
MCLFQFVASEKVVIQGTVTQEATTVDQVTLEESLSKLTVNDFVKSESEDNEKELAKQDLLSILKLNNGSSRSSSKKSESPVEIIDYADMEIVTKAVTPIIVNENDHEDEEETEEDKGTEEEDDIEVDEEETDEEEEEEEITSSEESDDEEAELYYEGGDSDDDELLEEDMLIMRDYLENIELEEGEDLNDLLVWSAMQEGNLEVELEPSDDNDDLYDYATLDQEPTERTLSDFEEEEAAILLEKKKKIFVDESTRTKKSHKAQVDDTIVDPQIFGQTLKAALADVPPGLRPGMRRWYEKQQRKEDRQKKKEEAKAHRREKKKNGKGKAKDVDEAELSNQMLKIDE